MSNEDNRFVPKITRSEFVEAYAGRALKLDALEGPSREVAEAANEGDDAVLQTPSELGKLFTAVEDRFDHDGQGGVLWTRDFQDNLTDAGRVYDDVTRHFEGAPAHGIDTKRELFADGQLLDVEILGWPKDRMSPQSLTEAVKDDDAELLVYRAADTTHRQLPGQGAEKDLIARATGVELRTSGNMTNGTPKSSYKVETLDKGQRVLGMSSLNLKSMWNDVSQMREALAWDLFAHAGVHAPQHAYVRASINDKYAGLYSMIEQVDGSFLKDHFGKNKEGNLYKAYWINEDLGPATLGYRQGADGDDTGKQYFKAADIDGRSYQLKTNEKDPKASTYDDLATFIRTLNGKTAPGVGDARFNTPEYKQQMEAIFDVKGFLRWASANMLLGAWDNYYGTPANYYLYNSGKTGAADQFMEKPYFNWIPWDYDNSFGIDFFNTQWQYNDIVNPAAGTVKRTGTGQPAETPLITNLLKNDAFKAYYLDHLEYLLDTWFNPEAVAQKIGTEGGNGIWELIRHSAYAEADGPQSPPHTGRQWTNDQLYWNGFQNQELYANGGKLEGILHYVAMRHDSAKAQLAELRKSIPKGSSGETFPAKPSAPPPA